MNKNLIEGLQDEMNRVRDIIKVYEEVSGGAGIFAITMMKASIKEAEKSMAEGDVIEEMKCYESLKTYEL